MHGSERETHTHKTLAVGGIKNSGGLFEQLAELWWSPLTSNLLETTQKYWQITQVKQRHRGGDLRTSLTHRTTHTHTGWQPRLCLLGNGGRTLRLWQRWKAGWSRNICTAHILSPGVDRKRTASHTRSSSHTEHWMTLLLERYDTSKDDLFSE